MLGTLADRLRLCVAGLQARCLEILRAPEAGTSSRQLELSELERRILFSATPLAVAIEAVESASLDSGTVLMADTVANVPSRHQQADPCLSTEQSGSPVVSLDTVTDNQFSTPDLITDRDCESRLELVVIDKSVPEYQQLLESILINADAHRRMDVVVLDQHADGLDAISSFLSTRQKVDAVHILTHGAHGTVSLGNAQLTIDSLAQDAGGISAWRSSLTPTADILFYGCDLAASADGRLLIEEIAVLSQSDVAASTDSTGSTALDGDWDLEYQTGLIESESVITGETKDVWSGLLNLPPVTTSSGGESSSQVTVAENSLVVTTFTATDEDVSGQTLSYSINGGDDADQFSIDSASGVLTFLSAPDFESPTDADSDSVYELSVAVSDGTGNSDLQNLSVMVTDNPQVYDPFLMVSYSGNEGDVNWLADWTEFGESNGPASGNVQVFSADHMRIGGLLGIGGFGVERSVDLSEAVSAVLEFDYRRTGLLLGLGSITAEILGDSGATWSTLATYSLLNLDSTFQHARFDISDYLDAATRLRFRGSGTALASFLLDNVSIEYSTGTPPVLTSVGGGPVGMLSVTENSASVTTVTATDADLPEQSLKYSITGGTDAARFSIDAESGLLTFVTAPDFENPSDADEDNVYELTVSVNDGPESLDSQDLLVTVTDVNEFTVGPLTDIDTSTDVVLENAHVGTAVGLTTTAIDLDGTSLVTYSLVDSAGGRFGINSSTGVVTVAGALDRESSSSHSIIVRATSTDRSFVTRGYTITVGDVNEFAVSQPDDLDESPNTVAELAATGTPVGITVSASDGDATNSTITYSLADTAGGRFTINSVTGVVSVADGRLLAGESVFEYHITARAVSEDGSTATLNFTVILNSDSGSGTNTETDAPADTIDSIHNGSKADSSVDGIISDGPVAGKPSAFDPADSDLESNAQQTHTTGNDITDFVSCLAPVTSTHVAGAPGVSVLTNPVISTDTLPFNLDLTPAVDSLVIGTSMTTENARDPGTDLLRSGADINGHAELLSVDDFGELRRHLDEMIAVYHGSQLSPYPGHADIRTLEIAMSSLAVGCVAYLLKGGTLIVGVATSLPAWTTVDILPVLQFSSKYTELDEDGDSLESLLQAS